MLQLPDLPEERNSGNADMVALLTALSQVHLVSPVPHREGRGPLEVSCSLSRPDRTQTSTRLLPVYVLSSACLSKGGCVSNEIDYDSPG